MLGAPSSILTVITEVAILSHVSNIEQAEVSSSFSSLSACFAVKLLLLIGNGLIKGIISLFTISVEVFNGPLGIYHVFLGHSDLTLGIFDHVLCSSIICPDSSC